EPRDLVAPRARAAARVNALHVDGPRLDVPRGLLQHHAEPREHARFARVVADGAFERERAAQKALGADEVALAPVDEHRALVQLLRVIEGADALADRAEDVQRLGLADGVVLLARDV